MLHHGGVVETAPAELVGSLRVLVADDNQDSADTLGFLVRVWGYEVQVCYDGVLALEKAHSYQPDVMLLDISMPGMDGYRVAEHVRENDSLRDTFLIAIT